MCCDEQYPVVIRSDDSRRRAARVLLMANGVWQLDWIGGLTSLNIRDPRRHLKLEYEPEHLRFERPSKDDDDDSAAGSVPDLGS